MRITPETCNAGEKTVGNKNRIAVVGVSARAACWSVIRAGLTACAYDQFCDLDFPPGCDVRLFSSRESLRSSMKGCLKPRNEFCLPVGGWENDTEIGQHLESDYSLLNTNCFATKLSRDPFLIQQILQNANLPGLKVRTAGPGDQSEKWIRKPLAGTGGIGIKTVLSATDKVDADCYDQQFTQGDSYAAVFFASKTGPIKLLGITKQIIGSEELPDRPYAYAGSIGPVFAGNNPAEVEIRDTLQQMADALNSRIEFYGLVCFDFVLSRNVPYLVEINPRYSASIELLELALQESFLRLFFDSAVLGEQSDVSQNESIATLSHSGFSKRIGKTILYAWQEMKLPDDWDWNRSACMLNKNKQSWKYGPWTVPVISDLPAPGTSFSVGDPVCTIWTEHRDIQSCIETLREKNAQLKRYIIEGLE